jgi:post-segregation antitoxin (ccd killing protein)
MAVKISDIPEQGPRHLIRAEQEKCWLQDNQEALANYNLRVAEYGLLSDDCGLLQRL